MLFYGITLIMKEKSNASALLCSQTHPSLLPDTFVSAPAFADKYMGREGVQNPEKLSRWRLCGKSLVCGPARAESPTSPEPRATPWVPCPHSLRPVRAKVKANRSPILLPLQGVGVYTLIPRALPWAMNWLPFQGAPFRALFVYHVRMLRHLLFGSKPRRDFFLFRPGLR